MHLAQSFHVWPCRWRRGSSCRSARLVTSASPFDAPSARRATIRSGIAIEDYLPHLPDLDDSITARLLPPSGMGETLVAGPIKVFVTVSVSPPAPGPRLTEGELFGVRAHLLVG